MSTLNKLINQKVFATIEGEEQNYEIEGIVLGVDVNDFYFYDKGEPIYITVSIKPTKELPEDIDIEELLEMPLANIRKA